MARGIECLKLKVPKVSKVGILGTLAHFRHFSHFSIRPAHGGFTLIELMIVVVILGLLATIIMPRILSRPEQARRAKAKIDIRNIESALALFKTDTGRFPTTSEGLEALVSDPGIKGYSPDGYLDRVPVDPWGNKYIYISPGVHSRDYDLESYGRDGEDGGSGDDADIERWNLDT